MLDDVHGGAGEQLVEWLYQLIETGTDEDLALQINIYQTEVNKFIPGFGHRFHKPVDPRAPRLMHQAWRTWVNRFVKPMAKPGNEFVYLRLIDVDL